MHTRTFCTGLWFPPLADSNGLDFEVGSARASTSSGLRSLQMVDVPHDGVCHEHSAQGMGHDTVNLNRDLFLQVRTPEAQKHDAGQKARTKTPCQSTRNWPICRESTNATTKSVSQKFDHKKEHTPQSIVKIRIVYPINLLISYELIYYICIELHRHPKQAQKRGRYFLGHFEDFRPLPQKAVDSSKSGRHE